MVDFTRIVSGPFATQILGDLGANIIKIERPGVGDEARPYGVTEGTGPGATFLAMNRNKRSVAINLQRPEGRDVALRLLEGADVTIHNYRPGVMERLGLDYPVVRARNPGIVYAAISGYGSTGPMREVAANDLAVQAHSGLLGITGESDRPPVRVPTPVADITAGLYSVIGILAALSFRARTGAGQLVETNMLEGQLNMLSYMFVDFWLTGTPPKRMGTANRMGLPNQAFETADGWICIVAPTDRAWKSCCEALDVPSLATDCRFATLRDRYEHRDELVTAVTAATMRWRTGVCMERLTRAGVPCARVNSFPDVVADPQVAALGAVTEMVTEEVGSIRLIRSPLHLSASPVSERTAPPRLGADTDGVLGAARYTIEEIAELRAAGAIE